MQNTIKNKKTCSLISFTPTVPRIVNQQRQSLTVSLLLRVNLLPGSEPGRCAVFHSRALLRRWLRDGYNPLLAPRGELAAWLWSRSALGVQLPLCGMGLNSPREGYVALLCLGRLCAGCGRTDGTGSGAELVGHMVDAWGGFSRHRFWADLDGASITTSCHLAEAAELLNCGLRSCVSNRLHYYPQITWSFCFFFFLKWVSGFYCVIYQIIFISAQIVNPVNRGFTLLGLPPRYSLYLPFPASVASPHCSEAPSHPSRLSSCFNLCYS